MKSRAQYMFDAYGRQTALVILANRAEREAREYGAVGAVRAWKYHMRRAARLRHRARHVLIAEDSAA